MSVVYSAGAPLGGLLFGIGRAVPFLFDACSYVFSLASLLAIRSRFQEQREPEPAARLRSQFAEGFRWLWKQRFLRACALLFAGTNFVFEALFLVLIVTGRRSGLSGFEVGLLVAGLGGCSLAGSALATRLHGRLSMRALVLVLFWSQLAVAGFLIHPSVYVLLAGLVPISLINPAVNAAVIGYRVAVVPDRLTGRVNSIARTVALVASPLGPLAAGLLLSAFSPRTTVAVFVAVIGALAVVATASAAVRQAPSLSELDSIPRPDEKLLIDPSGS
jgi:predicted MFS family arabinose efflux permease